MVNSRWPMQVVSPESVTGTDNNNSLAVIAHAFAPARVPSGTLRLHVCEAAAQHNGTESGERRR